MLRKVTILAVTLMLLLAAAQVALAQQDTGTTQPAQDTQSSTAPDPAQQEDASQTQPTGEVQASPLNLDGLIHLNENNNLLVRCEAVPERLSQLNQLGEMQANDPQFQAALARVNDLAQLCADSGFTPSSAGESSTPTTTPPTNEASDASNPGSTTG
jgi:hypothetical protein